MPPFPLLRQLGLALAISLVLSACASVGPDYRAPDVAIAPAWQAALPHAGSSAQLLDWWQRFDDPTLLALLRSAEADSPSLAKAAAAIASARASQDTADASSLPSLTASAKASRSGTAKAERSQTSRSSLGALDASWEIDLFGAVRRGQEAAQARAEASVADWHEARVSLAAEVASEYVQYRACQLLSASQASHLSSLQQTERSTASAVAAGLSAPADAALASASLANAAATLNAQNADCALHIKALVALSGLAEPALRAQLDAAAPALPQPAGLALQSLPVQLLSQRPDLVSAERQLAAASAAIGQAEANRYPRLSLLGSISLNHSQSGGSSSETAPWSFGPTLSLPLFDGGASQAAVRASKASYASSLASYQQAVRNAVKEVEQALVRLDSASQRQADVARSAAGYRQYFLASEQLWRAGGSSLLSLEQSRRDALSAEQSLITVQRDRVLYGIALYKALGGGWQADTSSSGSHSMKHPIRIAALTGAVLLALGGALSLYSGAQAKTGSQAQPADKAVLTVQLVQASQARWPRSLPLSGALAAWQEASISAETGGLRITALHADVGSRVKRGQLLAELASDTVQAELRQAQASVAQARASLLEAQANARRGQAVKDSGALSSQQIEQYQIAEQSAAAGLASSEAQLSSARIKLTQTRILAVDDGIISSRSATLGAVLGSGSELFRLLRQGRLEWRAEVSAQQLGLLQPGQAASITLPDGSTVSGKLRQLAPTLASDTRNALAYIDLPAQSAARAGMYVRGQITLGEAQAWVVPASAITVRDGHSYVFEVDAQHKVIQRKVETGRSQGAQTEIVSGLNPQAQLVRSGGAFLNDGDSVRLAPAGKEAV